MIESCLQSISAGLWTTLKVSSETVAWIYSLISLHGCMFVHECDAIKSCSMQTYESWCPNWLDYLLCNEQQQLLSISTQTRTKNMLRRHTTPAFMFIVLFFIFIFFSSFSRECVFWVWTQYIWLASMNENNGPHTMAKKHTKQVKCQKTKFNLKFCSLFCWFCIKWINVHMETVAAANAKHHFYFHSGNLNNNFGCI